MVSRRTSPPHRLQAGSFGPISSLIALGIQTGSLPRAGWYASSVRTFQPAESSVSSVPCRMSDSPAPLWAWVRRRGSGLGLALHHRAQATEQLRLADRLLQDGGR